MSRLSKILLSFGFGEKNVNGKIHSARKVQIAFLENLYFAGYFKDKKIWHVISIIDFNDNHPEPHGRWKKGRYATLKHLRRITNKAGANQDHENLFHADYLLDHVFEDENFFEEKDIEDIVVQLGQNAFGRLKNQERVEIASEDWAKIHRKKYLENAKKLGLLSEKKPLFKKYDETWIQGSALPSAILRLQYLQKINEEGIDTGAIRVMTGARELWLEIDKLENVDQTKEFMLKLAQENEIPFNKKEKFIGKKVGESTRTFLNTTLHMLSETMMMKKLYGEIVEKEFEEIIDSHPREGESRPTTAIVAHDVAKGNFGEKIKKGGFKNHPVKILIISNQPYCHRQALTIENVVVKELGHDQEIIFDPAGPESEDCINIIHSEFGALINEGFKHKSV